jgi:hypothetical protein
MLCLEEIGWWRVVSYQLGLSLFRYNTGAVYTNILVSRWMCDLKFPWIIISKAVLKYGVNVFLLCDPLKFIILFY